MRKYCYSLMICGLLLCASVAQAEPVVSFNPSKTVIGVGDTFTVDIFMTDFPTTQGGGLTLDYRPSVLQAIGVTVNEAQWSFINQPGTIDNTHGIVSDILFSAFPGASSDSTIATIEFEAVGKGSSHLRLTESIKNSFASSGELIEVSFEQGRIRVQGAKRGTAKSAGK